VTFFLRDYKVINFVSQVASLFYTDRFAWR